MRTRLVVGIALTLVLVSLALAANDPFVGTWKMNIAKSTFSPGPAPTSVTTNYKAEGKNLKMITDLVNAQGKASHMEDTLILDGKDHPDTSNPNYDSSARTRVDRFTIVTIYKKGGQEVGSRRIVASKDGKTLSGTVKVNNAKGEVSGSTFVFDKQ